MEIPNHIEHIPTCRYQIPTVQVQNTCTYLLLYHYPPVFLQEIPAPVSAPISASVSAPVSAQSHRRLRGLIAVASPHRIASLTSLE